MDADPIVRQHLLALLQGGNAHMTLDQAVAGFPMDQINQRLPNVPYSPWHLLEHIRIAQWDILEFIDNPDHVSPPWPDGYWPPAGEEGDPEKWQATLDALRVGAGSLEVLVRDEDTDLYSDLPHAPGYTVLREILLVADHNAYHLGQIMLIRRALERNGGTT